MKVVSPLNTNHTIVIEPRFSIDGVISMVITKEGYNTITELIPTYNEVNAVGYLTFNLVGEEQDRFSVKVTRLGEVVYRCKLFFTEQTPQDFKLNKDTFIYV